MVVSYQLRKERAQENGLEEDTVQLEDIFKHLNDEVQPYQLGITQLTPEYINPIQRYTMFRMPGRQPREPASFALRFKLSSQCLCQKYNYQVLKNHILRVIDQDFAQMQRKFFHKMQKSLSKQLDVGLFRRDLDDQKAIMRLKDVNIMKAVHVAALKQAEAFWDGRMKATFLHGYSLQQQINEAFKKFAPMCESALQGAEIATYCAEDYHILLQKTRFSAMNQNFVTNFCALLDKLTEDIAHVHRAAQQLQIRLTARREQISALLRYLDQIRYFISQESTK